MLVEQRDLCAGIAYIDDEIDQGLIFNSLTNIHRTNRMGECPD